MSFYFELDKNYNFYSITMVYFTLKKILLNYIRGSFTITKITRFIHICKTNYLKTFKITGYFIFDEAPTN